MTTGRHYLTGQWHSGGTRRFTKTNPAAASQVLGDYPIADAATIDRAVRDARAAFPAWRRTSRIRRGEILDRLARLIDRELDALAKLMATEAGKVLGEAKAEIVEARHMVEYVVGTARQPIGEVLASEVAAKDLMVIRKPRGVVAVITPWNFPLAVPLWMIAPSLLEGNTVVFKPSEETPGLGERLVELAIEAGIPPGVLQLVHGTGEETGDALARHPEIDVICFTGSYAVGSQLRRIAAASPHKTCALEMGSKSAVIVCDDADLDLAVQATLLSAFKTSGQRCVSAGRAIVHASIEREFTDRLVAKAESLAFGDPLDASSFAGPLINQAALEKVVSYNELAAKEGAEMLLAGGRITDAARAGGWFLSPCIYRQRYAPGLRTIREEVFGPHLAVIPFSSDEEGAHIYNDTQFGLSLGVISESYRRLRYYRDECDYGMCYLNLPCIGAEVHVPFGGVKQSGNGQPSAAGLVDAVTHRVVVTTNHERGISMAQGLSSQVPGK